MKTVLSFLRVLMASALVFAAVSCSSGDTSSSDGDSLSYLYLTQNRGYIGGSLIWNPGKGAGQLQAGTKIAVRLGKLTSREVSIKEYSSVSDVTLDDSDFTPSEFESSTTDTTTTFKTAFNGNSSGKTTIFEDDPAKAIYGYITINTIGADAISFTYTRVEENNSTSSKSFTLKKGETADLDGNGYHDIKYDEPEIQRTDYENAMWLTFINEKTKPYSSMYFTFTKSAARAGYRATNEEAEKVDEGLYGVNSEGNFIYITNQERPSGTEGLAHGDYIISLAPYEDTAPGEVYNTVTEGEEFPADYDPMASENQEEFLNYAGKQDVAFKYVDDESYNSCYLVTKNTSTLYDNDLTFVTRDQLKKQTIDYQYVPYQFPDQKDGPAALVKELAKNESVKKALLAANGKTASEVLPVTSAECISLLNKALPEDAFFMAVVDARVTKENVDNTSSDEEAKQHCKTQWNNAANNQTKKVQYARVMIDELYDESPDAVAESPTLETAYPTVAANIGSVSELNQAALRYADVYTSTCDEDGSGRKLYTTNEWAAFEKKRQEMRNNWKKYHQLSILSLIFPGNKDREVRMRQAGFDLGVGIKGSVTNPSGQFRVDAGIVLYADIDLSVETLANIMMDSSINPKQKDAMHKLLEKAFKERKNCTVKGTDVQLQLGPVPLVFGLALRSGLRFDLGNLSPHIAFVGMCGGDAYVDVHYGWKVLLPYVHVDAGSKGFASNEMFVGITNAEALATEGTTITFEPWINLTPSAGVGKSVLSARVSLPITVGTEFKFAVKPSALVPVFDRGAYTFRVEFMPYAEVNLKFIKFRLTILRKMIMNNELVFVENGQPIVPRWNKRKDSDHIE